MNVGFYNYMLDHTEVESPSNDLVVGLLFYLTHPNNPTKVDLSHLPLSRLEETVADQERVIIHPSYAIIEPEQIQAVDKPTLIVTGSGMKLYFWREKVGDSAQYTTFRNIAGICNFVKEGRL